MMYALILDDEGVVINVAVYHPVDSVGWLELMEERGARIIINEENTVGIGSTIQPDGSFVREQEPSHLPAPAPPAALPEPAEGEAQWQQHHAPEPSSPTPRQPVIRDADLARHLGVAPADDDGVVQGRGRIMTALIIEQGVVINAAVYHTVDSLQWLELVRAQGLEVIIVPEHSAGVGWIVHTDGSVIPPRPRPGLVWNGNEWRAPGSENVVRPSHVQGWFISRSEELSRTRTGPDGTAEEDSVPYDPYAAISGWVIVPDSALEGGLTHAEIAQQSIVMLESQGSATPLLARLDGLAGLRERSEQAANDAISAHEAATGASIEHEEAQRLRGAVMRISEAFLRLFQVDAAA